MIYRCWETICFWLAFYLVPRTLVTCCFIRVFADSTTGKYDQTDCTKITCADALQRWYTNCDLCPDCGANLVPEQPCSVCFIAALTPVPIVPIPAYDAKGEFLR